MDERIVTCVYCGQEYPDGTPTSGANVLTEHIKACEKHPMRKLEAQNQIMREFIQDISIMECSDDCRWNNHSLCLACQAKDLLKGELKMEKNK